jgi:hypothetical protein
MVDFAMLWATDSWTSAAQVEAASPHYLATNWVEGRYLGSRQT